MVADYLGRCLRRGSSLGRPLTGVRPNATVVVTDSDVLFQVKQGAELEGSFNICAFVLTIKAHSLLVGGGGGGSGWLGGPGGWGLLLNLCYGLMLLLLCA